MTKRIENAHTHTEISRVYLMANSLALLVSAERPRFQSCRVFLSLDKAAQWVAFQVGPSNLFLSSCLVSCLDNSESWIPSSFLLIS
jgi:hypothetical protein